MLSGLPPFYQDKLQEQGVQDIVSNNKIKSESYGDLVDKEYSGLNETLINNQEPHSQIENDEISGAEFPNDNDSEGTEINKISAVPNFLPQILPDDEISEGINSLNLKQREVFNVLHKWVESMLNVMDIMLN